MWMIADKIQFIAVLDHRFEYMLRSGSEISDPPADCHRWRVYPVKLTAKSSILGQAYRPGREYIRSSWPGRIYQVKLTEWWRAYPFQSTGLERMNIPGDISVVGTARRQVNTIK